MRKALSYKKRTRKLLMKLTPAFSQFPFVKNVIKYVKRQSCSSKNVF
jgi:hypothetical protein